MLISDRYWYRYYNVNKSTISIISIEERKEGLESIKIELTNKEKIYIEFEEKPKDLTKSDYNKLILILYKFLENDYVRSEREVAAAVLEIFLEDRL